MTLKDITKEIQTKVGTTADGIWGPATASAVLKALGGSPAEIRPTRKYIAIDIGHANGTGSLGNDLDEHEVCARLSGLLRHELETLMPDCKVEVFDFPTMDNDEDLGATARVVNEGDFDICLSLHCDHADSNLARGAHVIYYKSEAKRLAVEIADQICDLLPGRADTIVKRNLYILRTVKCPGVLIENGFLSNAQDADFLRNNLRTLAEHIAIGVKNYFNKD